MADSALDQRLEETFGTDIGFDATQGEQDVTEEFNGADYNYQIGPQAIREEIERLFITPQGSLVDDPDYGIDLAAIIGQQLDPRVMVGLVRFEVKRALEHPSFRTRFRVKQLQAVWLPSAPNAVYVLGVIEIFGFEGAFWQFGPTALALAQGRQQNG